MTVHDIDWSCPSDLEPYARAHELELQENDRMMHAMCGNYILSAVSVAIEHCLAGRKAKSKYINKPILEHMKEQRKELSEEELQRQRELFVAKLEVMKANFELNHKDSMGS